jgi:spore coat polysaccharide biosynthesis protein SpsF
MSRVGIITQARTTSTRLPGKVLIQVAGRSLLEHHLDRLASVGVEVLVATTVNAADDPIADIAASRGLACSRGSEHDVLARFHDCAAAAALDVVVRVTSDCPLIDGRVIADGIGRYLAAGDEHLYLSNALRRTFPRGMDFEVFSASALADAALHATAPAHREHVTPYLYENAGGSTRLAHVTWPVDRSGYRITLDTPDDLTLMRALIEDHGAHRLDCAGIIALLDEHPELARINAHVEQKTLGP